MGIQRLQATLEHTAARLHAHVAVVAGRTKIISAERRRRVQHCVQCNHSGTCRGHMLGNWYVHNVHTGGSMYTLAFTF